MTLRKEPFGRLTDGTAVEKYILATTRGITAELLTYGGILRSLTMPDRRGRTADVTLGFDDLESYATRSPYFGALLGRCANRIAGGTFVIEGTRYRLACNNGPNHLHGGLKGFDKAVWKARPFQKADVAGLALSYVSRDGEEGYPGNLRVEVTVSLSEGGELAFQFSARTDRPTPVNLSQHSYWNLAGSGTILDHELELNCPFYLPVDPTLIPTGEVLAVAGTPMDFTRSKPVGRDIGKVPGGYDHCWAGAGAEHAFRHLATLHEPSGGRGLEVWTTLPGLQFYTGNFLDGVVGAGGAVYNRHSGLCLEAEYFPDAVNRPHFPDCLLEPGRTCNHRIEYRLFVR
jgi:aldose 1-epimerase